MKRQKEGDQVLKQSSKKIQRRTSKEKGRKKRARFEIEDGNGNGNEMVDMTTGEIERKEK